MKNVDQEGDDGARERETDGAGESRGDGAGEAEGDGAGESGGDLEGEAKEGGAEGSGGCKQAAGATSAVNQNANQVKMDGCKMVVETAGEEVNGGSNTSDYHLVCISGEVGTGHTGNGMKWARTGNEQVGLESAVVPSFDLNCMPPGSCGDVDSYGDGYGGGGDGDGGGVGGDDSCFGLHEDLEAQKLMSGRAGRRGKDSKEIVIVMVNEEMTMEACKEMMLRRPAPVESSFRLTYYALLNLMAHSFRLTYYALLHLMARSKGQFNAEHVIAHSFHQFQHDRQVPEVEKRIKQLYAEADTLDAGNEDEIREYNALRLSLAEKERQLNEDVLRPDRCLTSCTREDCLSFASPSFVQIRMVDRLDDWGWGVIVNVIKQPSQTSTKSAVIAPSPTASVTADAPLSTTAYLVDTLPLCSRVVDSGGGDGSTAQLVPRPCELEGNEEMHVVSEWLRLPLPVPLLPQLHRVRK
ncbi:unnamed protein product [Closterium sp. NIES-65]|nr:unnamed protein product [Closterium sp. NIES-65]